MIFLIRHAMVDACGRFLAGRAPGIHLNAEGRRQAADLRDALVDVPIGAIYCSPLERARETANAIAGDRVNVAIAEDLNEVDFGDWTGATFQDLNERRDWLVFNRSRSTNPIPGGERMCDVQTRACRLLSRVHGAHPGATVALVSHADVLRALVARIIDMPLDRLDAFALDPASISVLSPHDHGFELTHLNCHAYSGHCCASSRRAS